MALDVSSSRTGLSRIALILGPALALALLVFHGKYEPIEYLATLLNILFVSTIIYCVFAVQRTQYAFGFDEIASGFSLKLPAGVLALAVTAFGITGSGRERSSCTRTGVLRRAMPPGRDRETNRPSGRPAPKGGFAS